MLIFNFHHVEPKPRLASRQHISITTQGLLQFIRTLRRLGLSPISLRDVITMGGPAAAPENCVVLTFDDGYENFYQHAVPILEAEQCPATVFVLAGRFGGTNDWDQSDMPVEERDRLMTVEQMKTLAASSYVTLGSHGLMHVNYKHLSVEALEQEMQDSYRILSDELGKGFIPAMAYPWGAYADNALAVMENSSYQYGFTTEKGIWTATTQRFQVPRFSAYYRDGNPLVLLAKLCRNNLASGEDLVRFFMPTVASGQ